jgi:hypothetical protein
VSQQLFLAIGTEHVCPTCKVPYFCDEDDCAVPPGAGQCPKCNQWFVQHYFNVYNRCKRDPFYAAKIDRIMARQLGERSCIGSLQIRQPEGISE